MFDYKLFEKPVVFFANAIGDHLIALPTMRALSHIFNGQISLMALPNAHSEIFVDIVFKEVWPIRFPNSNHRNWYSGVPGNSDLPFNYEELAEQAKGCDLFLSLTSWHTPELQKLLDKLAPSISMGFFPKFKHIVVSQHDHAFDSSFSLAHEFVPDVQLEDFANPPIISTKHKKLVEELQTELRDEHRLLIVHTDTKKRKMWNPDKFLSVVDLFLAEHSNYLAVIIGLWNYLPVEQAINKDRIFDLCGLSIDLSFGIISIGDVFLGIDSCMLHAADLFRVPGVGIFGPTDPKNWGFRFSHHEHVYTNQLDLLSEKCVLNKLSKLVPLVI